MGNWYNTLKKSALTPPAWVFGPAWTILYILIFLSIFIYIRSGYTRLGLILFSAQLISNFIWTRLFFGQQLICVSFANILLLNSLVYLTYKEFLKSSRVAAYLLIPYIIWILFAAYLNGYICLNN
jgi:benzodiazapine receptor